MSDTVIRIENLSKQYVLGGNSRASGELRRAVHEFAMAPLRWMNPRKSSKPPAAASLSQAPGRKAFFALEDVTFEVRRGEVLGVIGRNGAGKSTLLKILSRITEPTSGRVGIKGRVASLLEVGTGFHPELTGRENIYLNGAILGMTQAEVAEKFEAIVEFAEIAEFLDTPVKCYSSGMYMRLAFAVAAHLEPEILLVDEVLAVGDAQFQKKCLGKMGAVARGGRTVLFVSHNMAAVNALCDRAILLDSGRLEADGNVSTTIQRYFATMRSEAGADLSHRHDREGQGRVRFTRVRLEDTNGHPVEVAVSGSPLVIALDYSADRMVELRRVRASVHVTDAIGQVLTLFSTELTHPEELVCPPSGTIRCILPSLPLTGSEYYLSPFIEVAGEVQDYIPNAAVLRVEDGDFYGTGKLYPPGWQGIGVLTPHRWEVSAQ